MAANVISGALGRLKVPVVLLELIGPAVVAGLAGLWLQIPDSHAWEFGVSVVSGVGILLGFLWLHTTVVRRLRGDVSGSGRVGMGLLAVWLVFWRVLAAQVSLLSVHAEQRAGFWNSRLSAQQRVIFTEPKLLAWQMDAISTVLLVRAAFDLSAAGDGDGDEGAARPRGREWGVSGYSPGVWAMGDVADGWGRVAGGYQPRGYADGLAPCGYGSGRAGERGSSAGVALSFAGGAWAGDACGGGGVAGAECVGGDASGEPGADRLESVEMDHVLDKGGGLAVSVLGFWEGSGLA